MKNKTLTLLYIVIASLACGQNRDSIKTTDPRPQSPFLYELHEDIGPKKPFSEQERSLGRALRFLTKIPFDAELPDTKLPLGKFVEQLTKASAKSGTTLKIEVPANLFASVRKPPPLRELTPFELRVEPDFIGRLWDAFSAYGVRLDANAKGELTLRSERNPEPLDESTTTEFKVRFPIPDANQMTAEPNENQALLHLAYGAEFPKATLMITSKSASTLTIYAPRWRHLAMYTDLSDKKARTTIRQQGKSGQKRK